MFRSLPFIALMGLVACAPAPETCSSPASRDLTILRGLIAETEATLARGYALHQVPDTILYSDYCPAGDQILDEAQFCDRLQPVTRVAPVAVNLHEEREKLTTLRRHEARLEQSLSRQLAECPAQ